MKKHVWSNIHVFFKLIMAIWEKRELGFYFLRKKIFVFKKERKRRLEDRSCRWWPGVTHSATTWTQIEHFDFI